MRIRPPIKGTPGRSAVREPMRLGDLIDRLGPRVDDIRECLGGEADLAVVLGHDVRDGDDVVLIATRTGVHVSLLWPDEDHALLGAARPGWANWRSVRVSPVHTEGWQVAGQGHDAQATHTCQVLIEDVEFLVSANGAAGQQAVDGFHDEVVRRGTPWHYPQSGHG